MNRKGYGFLLALALVSLAELNLAVASTGILPELIGTWDFASMSPLKDGKPFGTIQFKPGQWSLQLNQDGTYVEKMPLRKYPLAEGTYKVHGHVLEMKPANGKTDLKYRFALEEDGKVLVLTDKDKSITRANRE